MPYSGVVYEGGLYGDEDFIVESCTHEHRTKYEARRCGEEMARRRGASIVTAGARGSTAPTSSKPNDAQTGEQR